MTLEILELILLVKDPQFWLKTNQPWTNPTQARLDLHKI